MMQKLAKSRGGECLSTKYTGMNTEFEWKCKKGHIFMRKPQYIRTGKGFCNKCKQNGDE